MSGPELRDVRFAAHTEVGHCSMCHALGDAFVKATVGHANVLASVEPDTDPPLGGHGDVGKYYLIGACCVHRMHATLFPFQKGPTE